MKELCMIELHLDLCFKPKLANMTQQALRELGIAVKGAWSCSSSGAVSQVDLTGSADALEKFIREYLSEEPRGAFDLRYRSEEKPLEPA